MIYRLFRHGSTLRSMKAWQLEQLSLAGLVQRELPIPEPGPHQLLVRIRATSINPTDVFTATGAYGPLPVPFVPLGDGAGEVVRLGPGVTRVALGARVVATFAHGWNAGRVVRVPALGAGQRAGVLAEFAVFDEDAVVIVPEALSFDEAATLPVAGTTAWHALFVGAPVRPGQTVVVQGTGGVAMFAIQLAVAAGARVIALSRSDAKLAVAARHGATDTINTAAVPAWDHRVRELTGGVGADVVVDTAGTLARSIAATRDGGQVSAVGRFAGVRTEIDLIPLIRGNLRVQGILTGSRAMLEELVTAMVTRNLRPVIHHAYEFDQAPDAYHAIASREGYVGKLVIRGA